MMRSTHAELSGFFTQILWSMAVQVPEGADELEPSPLVTNISLAALPKTVTKKLEKAESSVRNTSLFALNRNF